MLPYQQQNLLANHGQIHNGLGNSFSGQITQPPVQPSRTLFLGDLSIYCTERDICQVFASFGPIESIHLKRVPQGATAHLSYGFVRYKHRLSAETALTSMQGAIFLGRPLRIGWAEDTRNLNPVTPYQTMVPKRSSPFPPMSGLSTPVHPTVPNSMSMPPPPSQPPHAQIHVTFVSNHLKIVTEAFLRHIFETFGEVLDVSIKKLHVNKDNGQQSGYGFIHYALDDLGVSAAVRAVDSVNESTIESIYFRCSVSHGLTRFIRDREMTAPHLFESGPRIDHMIHPNRSTNAQSFEKNFPPSYFSSNFHQEVQPDERATVLPQRGLSTYSPATFSGSSNAVTLLAGNRSNSPSTSGSTYLSTYGPGFDGMSLPKHDFSNLREQSIAHTYSSGSSTTTNSLPLSIQPENDLSQSIIDQLWNKF